MAYENFKATIWAAAIERSLQQKTLFESFCNKNIKGTPTWGNTVKILGAGIPTIKTYDPNGDGIGKAETPEGSHVELLIDQAKYFNFMVDDVDEAQAHPETMAALMDEAAAGMAGERDRFIASRAQFATMISETQVLGTESKIKSAIDVALRALREKNVSADKNVRIELPFWAYQKFKNQLVEEKTSNDQLIKTGSIGWYDNCSVVYSNNIYVDENGDTYAMVRTDKAIAFAGQVSKTEAYRPESFFSDAVKGLDVYGAKIVRPNEIYVIKMRENA